MLINVLINHLEVVSGIKKLQIHYKSNFRKVPGNFRLTKEMALFNGLNVWNVYNI